MAVTKYLDYNGLLYLWSLLKSKFNGKADKATTLAGYGITDANISNGVVTLGGDTITPITTITNADLPASGVSAGTYKSVTVDAKGVVTGGTNPTTLSGYGISDANISNGTITLGSDTITPLTSISNSDLPASGVSAGTYTSVTVDAKGVVTAGTSPTTLSGYGITDAYTKSEIDTKMTSAMHYKGSVATVADLPASNNEVGDFYNVTATGENYAWTGSAWDITGSIVDLQSITNAEIDTVVAS